MAVAERGTMYDPSAVFYMEKLATGPEAADVVDIRLPIEENIRRLAKAKGESTEDVTVVILDRPRHAAIVEQVRATGARIRFITDGDVAGAIMAARPDTGVDLLAGIGGTPEGIIAACAIKCLGGVIQGRLWPRDDDERRKALDAGHDLDRVLYTDDLVRGNNVFFVATGITDGELLRGVRYRAGGATTHSLVMRSRSGTIRLIESEHRLTKLRTYASVDFGPQPSSHWHPIDAPSCVVGESLVDYLPDATGHAVPWPGGSPANVARGLARLGRTVRLRTALGDDEPGRLLLTSLSTDGVDVDPASLRPGRSSTAAATLDTAGRATYDLDVHWDPGPLALDAETGVAAHRLVRHGRSPGAADVERPARARRGTGSAHLDRPQRPRAAALGHAHSPSAPAPAGRARHRGQGERRRPRAARARPRRPRRGPRLAAGTQHPSSSSLTLGPRGAWAITGGGRRRGAGTRRTSRRHRRGRRRIHGRARRRPALEHRPRAVTCTELDSDAAPRLRGGRDLLRTRGCRPTHAGRAGHRAYPDHARQTPQQQGSTSTDGTEDPHNGGRDDVVESYGGHRRNAKAPKGFRVEHDTMGEVLVPADAKYRAQTQRAVENFPISGVRLERAHIEALARIKAAAAKVNAKLGVIDRDMAAAIQEAADEVARGDWDAHFPIDVYQTGSGTSTNMNANEVIATLATERLGRPVHPNDHVNASQSSNDVFPSSIHVAATSAVVKELIPALRHLAAVVAAQGEEVRQGRQVRAAPTSWTRRR